MSTIVPTITPPKSMRADARRNYEQILAAARVGFAKHGPDASLEEIARHAGVGVGTLYRHFPTRLSLQEAVIRENTEAMIGMAAELAETATPGDALAAWLRAKLDHAASYRGLGAAVMNEIADTASPTLTSCWAMHDAGAELLARAQQAGVIRPDIDVSSLFRLIQAIAIAVESAPDGSVNAGQLLSIMLDGLRVPTAKS